MHAAAIVRIRRAALLLALLVAASGCAWLIASLLWPSPQSSSAHDRAAAIEPAPAAAPAPVFAPADAGRPLALAIDAAPEPSTPPDAATPSPPSGDIATLQLEIVHANGDPAAGAPVVIAQDETILAHGVTAHDGRLAVAAPDRDATLFVAGISRSVHTEPIAAGAGHRRIVLPEGVAISGRVTLLGAPPGPRVLGLQIRAVAGSRDKVESAILAALTPPVGDWGRRTGPLTQRVTGDGAFTFSGFGPGEDVVLLPPSGCQLLDGRRQLDLVAPASGVSVDLMPLPEVRGRAVWADTLLPDPGCRVRYRLVDRPRLPSGGAPGAHAASGSVSSFMTADDEGRFAIPLGGPMLAVTLWLADPEGRGLADVALDGTGIESGLDLGDVLLRPARTVTFRVRDAASQPIEGAFATATRGEELRSPRTGKEGTSEMRGLPAAPVEFTFWAASCETVRATAFGVSDEHLEVTLERCATLEVRVVPISGELPPHLQLCFAANSQAFTGVDEFGPEDTRTEIDKSMPSEIWSDNDGSTSPPTVNGKVFYDVPADGVIRISCLRPAVALTLSVTDAARATVWGEQVITLGRGEARTIDAPVFGVASK